MTGAEQLCWAPGLTRRQKPLTLAAVPIGVVVGIVGCVFLGFLDFLATLTTQ